MTSQNEAILSPGPPWPNEVLTATNRYGIDEDCDALPFLDSPGVCNRCGKALVGRQTQWCSKTCSDELSRQHNWTMARGAALRRDDRRCVRCGGDGHDQHVPRWAPVWSREQALAMGVELPASYPFDEMAMARSDGLYINTNRVWLPWLEVNHIEPRVGRGYGWGCHHHLTNLETLCHLCHVDETNRQKAARRGAKRAV